MMRERWAAAVILCTTAPTLAGCGATRFAPQPLPPSPAAAVIEDIQEFQQTLGVGPTGNIQSFSDRTRSINRCYFTSKLELPDSYAGLQMTEEDEAHCAARAERYDVFFYPIEAVAGGDAAVTPALADASTERLLVVVTHEDFHNQQKTGVTHPEVAEAAATLSGFLTASAFAREHYGPASPMFDRLQREASLFLRKAAIVNEQHAALRRVYEAYRAGWMSRDAAFAAKSQILDELQRACSAINPRPVSFNECPAAMN